jgi:hypothetical protein
MTSIIEVRDVKIYNAINKQLSTSVEQKLLFSYIKRPSLLQRWCFRYVCTYLVVN